MKSLIGILLSLLTVLMVTGNSYSQPEAREFGISVGGYSNFPANQNYLKQNMGVIYVAPYVRAGRHEFSLGLQYPVAHKGLYYTENSINPMPGFIAGYKYYVFNAYGRENLFIHYAFEYLRFKGKYDVFYSQDNTTYNWTEKDMYINNVIGLGYNVFFDMNGRFGLYYTLDYLISQAGYKLNSPVYSSNTWNTDFVWNRLSTHIGLLFKITSFNKKEKKSN